VGKFENDIENKLGGFSLTPSDHVWEGVEASLHEKKKRRFAIWWWIPVAGILLLGAGWWVLDSGSNNGQQPKELAETTVESKKQNLTIKEEEKKKAPETVQIVSERKDEEEVDAKESLVPENIAKKQSSLMDGTESYIKASQKKHATKRTVPAISTVNNVSTGEETTIENVEASKTIIASTNQQEALQEITVSKTVEVKVDSLVSKDSTATVAKNLLTQKDSTAIVALIDSTKKKLKKQQHQWSITAGGGISLVKGNNLISSRSYDALGNSFSISNPSGIGSGVSNMNAPSLPLPNTGFFILAGVAYEGSINRHWSGNIGLQYRYIQQNQRQDSLTNRSHWLDLPVSLQYTINPNSQVKYGLLIGGSVAWAFSQKWAYTPPTGYYYYDKALENNIIFGLNAGAFVKMKNGLTLSLRGEQSLTPIHKASNNKYYWRQWSAQVSLPLSLLYKPKN
jgi:hypothetical protein